MDWTMRFNEVMEYVEQHIHGTISERAVSQIMACPYDVFQGAFSQITGISFSEYVRRRKLTLAAYDLQNTDKTILDIGLDYGYQSGDAFRVAFKALHKVTPSQVRTASPTLTFYCQLEFKITIQGVDKINYTIIEKEAFDVIGIRKTTPYGGGTWAIVKSDGSNERINELSGKFFDLGLCFGFSEDGSNDYMCAIKFDGYTGNEFDTYHYPATTWLKFEVRGKISEDVLGQLWHKINTEFLPSSKFHKGPLPTIEKYVTWNADEDDCIVEVWIPQ